MRGSVHLILAFSIAVVVHVGAFVFWAPREAPGDAGAGGTARLTIAASAAAAMVEDWERAPDPLDRAVMRPAPPQDLPAPDTVTRPDAALRTAAPLSLSRNADADRVPTARPDAPAVLAVPVAVGPDRLRPPSDIERPAPPGLTRPAPKFDARVAPAALTAPGTTAPPDTLRQAPVEVKRPRQTDPRPIPRPGRTDEPRAASKAAGAGAAARAGQGQTRTTQGPAARANPALMARWGAEIRARVERRKSYPAAARGASGQTVLQLSVTSSGRLAGVGVVRSSGVAAIDRAAVGAVRRAGRFPPAPEGLNDGPHAFRLSLSFRG